MTRHSLLTVLLVLCACATPREQTVEAIRYRQLIVASAIDYMHGGGKWHDALYVPDTGVGIHVVGESDDPLAADLCPLDWVAAEKQPW